ncbi:hypothetical protein A3F06_01500 [candidate division TM6 bacterium RIFCSPHIGHO2_12_FULL_36_22]|nr:MAG: hypothetical protein A3F06_01500 [candidate division TM6 bacterium RIFCSPHIGHO2_12_FULL_36_22]
MKLLILSLTSITILLTFLFIFKEILRNKNKNAILIVAPLSLDEYHEENLHGTHNYKLINCRFASKTKLNDCINTCIEQIKHTPIVGIYSSRDYLGNLVSCLVAHKLGLPGPNPQTVLSYHHKYYSRLIQQQHVPEACPNFQLIDPKNIKSENIKLSFPLFIKPVKSYFSILAQKIDSFEQLQALGTKLMPSKEFLEPLNDALKLYSNYTLSANYLLAEELLSGQQVTIEGYIYNGEPYIFGVTDSIMYPGTISFERFEYPSSLPIEVQDRMADIAIRLMQSTKFDNSFFNIEYFYNSKDDTIKIIEVNPRLASQFADLYERVDGINSYRALMDLAAGKKPKTSKRKGQFKYAASCVLRVFEDKFVTKIPNLAHQCHVQALLPDVHIRIFAQEGKRLSDIEQDGKSFMYSIISLGGDSSEDIKRRLSLCKELLPFKFSLP